MQTLKTFNNSSKRREYKIKGNINGGINNIVYQYCNASNIQPKDYIGKDTTPSLRINNHRTTVLHQYSNLPVSAHTSEHKNSNLEDCYNLKGIQKQEEHTNPEINDAKLKNIEITLQLVLKSKIPNSLNIE